MACLDELFHAELSVALQLVVTLMHTVSCVRTLSIDPRRLGPRLCMHRPRAAKVALRRPRSRERRCSARRRRATEHFAPSWRPFGGATAANAGAAGKNGTPEPAPLGAVVGGHWRARSVLGTLPDGQNTGLWRTLNQVVRATVRRHTQARRGRGRCRLLCFYGTRGVWCKTPPLCSD